MGLINVKWQGSSLKQDASNRLVTDKEKTIWNNKANNSHTHTKSDIKDFPSSLPASDVYAWAKASSKPSYSKSEVGLGNVDNTADSVKNVAMATKLQTYKSDSSGTYGTEYPLIAQWDSNGKTVNMVCKGYTVRVQSSATADSANALNWVAGNEIKFTKPNYTTERDLHFCWSWADNSKVKLIKQYIFDGGDGNPTQVKASQFNGPLNGNASSASSVPWSGVTGKPSAFTPSSHTHNTIQDINNNQNVTFAYSKAGMDYGDYTWLAAWNGEELRAVTKGQFATAGHTHTKSQITDFPTSLKNPNKLSITVDGGDTGAAFANTYDGSAAESISVSSSTHNHDLTYLKLTGGTLTGTLSLKNTGLQIISNLPEDFSGTPRGDRQVLWYSKEFEDDDFQYEDYCCHYLNIGTANSGTGNGKFGAKTFIRFWSPLNNHYVDFGIGANQVPNNCTVFLPRTGSGTLQITSSDARLKTNINDTEVDDAISFINKIHLHSFDWKTDDTHQPIGFIADELEELDERLSVGGNSDELDENGLPIDPKCVNTFYLHGYEVKAIQELSSKVDALEKENEELKSRLTKLEDKLSKM